MTVADAPKRPVARFLEGSLLRHVTVMSVTSSVGLVAMFFVEFLDMIFISMLGQAELAAAVGYAGVVSFFTASVGIGVSIAAGALVARCLGAGEGDEARACATDALFFGLCTALVVTAVVMATLPFWISLVGATGETHRLTLEYLYIIVPSMPILLLGMASGAILRAHGDARRSMYSTLAGGFVNLVMDPILIFGFGLELRGAAIATVLARSAVLAMALWPLLRHHHALAAFDFAGFRAKLPAFLAIAAPAIATNVATPVGNAWVIRAMAEHGEAAVAGMAIVSRMTPVSFGVVFALSGAIGPIIGQNFGARQHERVRQAFVEGLRFAAVYVIGATALLFLFRAPIADLFGAVGITRELLYLFCGPLALMFFFNAAIFVGNAAFNNLGRPIFSTLVNWGRNTLGTIPFVLLGSAWLGAPGVLIGQAAGGVIFALIATWGAFRVMRWQAGRFPRTPEPAAKP
jgi:putative MATE family efflux protein